MNTLKSIFLMSAILSVAQGADVASLRFVDATDSAVAGGIVASVATINSAVTLTSSGSVARLGSLAGDLRYRSVDQGKGHGLALPTALGSSGSLYFVGDSRGYVSVGIDGFTGLAWQAPTPTAGSPLLGFGTLGTNLVAVTDTSVIYYGAAVTNLVLRPAKVVGANLFETFNAITGFSDGTGAVLGFSGAVRYSSDSGASWQYARPFGSSSASSAGTSAVKYGGRLFVTDVDGRIYSAMVPTKPNPTVGDWKWDSQTISKNPLRSIVQYGDALVIVGDGGGAWVSDAEGTKFTALTNIPPALAKADLITVLAPEAGALQGCLLVVASNGIYLATPTPAQVSVVSESSLGTCAGDPIPAGKSFQVRVADDRLASFMAVDWLIDAQRGRTNSTNFAVFADVPGTYMYYAVARDIRSGIQSSQVAVTHIVYPKPAVPTLAFGATNICSAEAPPTLIALPRTGVEFEWFADAVSRVALTNGSSYSPPTTADGVFYVEAVEKHPLLTCRSGERAKVAVIVHSNPAAPVAEAAEMVIGSCKDLQPLGVQPVKDTNVVFVWYSADGAILATNRSYLPNSKSSAVFTVRAVDQVTGCESVESTRIRLTVRPAPETPIPLSAKVAIASCQVIPPTLGVRPVADTNIDFVWYATSNGLASVALRTNVSYVPLLVTNATFSVRAVDRVTGCESLGYGNVELEVHPPIQRVTIQIKSSERESTNGTVIATVGTVPGLQDYHQVSWSTGGDGVFSSTNGVQAAYTPGTNDLARGSATLAVQVGEKGVECGQSGASIRVLFAPSLQIELIKNTDVPLLKWNPTSAFYLESATNIWFTNAVRVAEGVLGAYAETNRVVVERYYRLVMP